MAQVVDPGNIGTIIKIIVSSKIARKILKSVMYSDSIHLTPPSPAG
jgi:hypothetical protein